jgi:hypothetical protein
VEEEEENNDEEEEEEDNKEEEEETKVEEVEEEEEDTEEEEEEVVEEDVEEDEEETQEEEVEDKVLNKVLRNSADLLPFRGGEAWQGDSVDGNSSPNQKKSALKKVNDKKINKRNNSNTSNQKKKTPKKINDKKTNERHNSKSDDFGEVNNTTFKFDNNDKDASIFDSICGNDLKKEVAKNVKSSMKTDTIDIFITGPFCNAKTGKSYWIVVYGDYGSAWTLKS